MMPLAIAVEAADPVDRKQLVHDFVYNHVMYHVGEADVWNFPFVHIKAFDIFRYDAVMLGVGVLVMIATMVFFFKPGQLVPHGWTNMVEAFVLYIRDQVAIPSLGEKEGRRMTPLLCTYFVFIVTMNLLGLVPLFTTATGNVNVTAALSLITFGFMIFGTMVKNGLLGFLKVFVPPGLPIVLTIFMTPMEFVSMLSKVLALVIRLFANMMAGHIVIYSMLGLIMLFGLWASPVLILVLFLYFFEVFIAFFQAYIFTLLSAIYIGQFYHPEH